MPPVQPPMPAQQKPVSPLSAIISTVGGVLALLGFFLPWVTVANVSISGWFLVQHASDPASGLTGTAIAETYLSFAGALATLLIGIVALTGRRTPTLTNIQVLGALIGTIDLVLNLVNLNGSQINLAIIGYGFWIALGGFVLGLVGALMARRGTV